MVGPDRIPVLQPLAIVPHPVGVDQPGARGLGQPLKLPVNVIRHARNHPLRRRAKPVGRPVAPDLGVIPADPAGGQDQSLPLRLESAGHHTRGAAPPRGLVRLQNLPAHPPRFQVDAGHPVTEPHLQPSLGLKLPCTAHEGRDHPRPGAPCQMKARDGVAVPVRQRPAPFGPADNGKPAHPHAMQPSAHLSGGEVEIGLRHRPRIGILRPVKPGGPHPVLCRQITGVADLHPSLFRRVDHEEPAERPEGLPAKRLRPLLIQKQHLAPPPRRLRRGDQTGEARADDDHIGPEHAHSPMPRRFIRR